MVEENPHVAGLITEFIDGTLHDAERSTVEAHLESCTDCQQQYQEALHSRAVRDQEPTNDQTLPDESAEPLESPTDTGTPPEDQSGHEESAGGTEPIEGAPESSEGAAPAEPDVQEPSDDALEQAGKPRWHFGSTRRLGILAVLVLVAGGLMLWVAQSLIKSKVQREQAVAPAPSPVVAESVQVSTMVPVVSTAQPGAIASAIPAVPSTAAAPSMPAAGAPAATFDVDDLRALVDQAASRGAVKRKKSRSTAAPAATAPEVAPESAPEEAVPAPPPDVSSKFFIGSSGLPEWKGTSSGIRSFRTVVIHNEHEWRQLWHQHAGSANREPPEMDFDQFMIVGVFGGQKPKGASVEIYETEEAVPSSLLIYYREKSSDSESGSGTVQPYHMWVIIKTDLDVEFRKRS